MKRPSKDKTAKTSIADLTNKVDALLEQLKSRKTEETIEWVGAPFLLLGNDLQCNKH